MAHRFSSRQDAQIDPFNAGDPIMPWDDPQTEHDEWYTDEDVAYDAPSPDRTGRRGSRGNKRAMEDGTQTVNQPKLSERGAQEQAVEFDGSAFDKTSREDAAPTGRRRRTVPKKGTGQEAPVPRFRPVDAPRPEDDVPGAAARPAKKKRHGCLAFIGALIIFRIAVSLLSCAGTVVDDFFSSDMEDAAVSLFEDEEDTYSYEADDEDEAACVEAAENLLDTLSENETARALVVYEFEDLLEGYTGRSASELGLDSEAFADWYFEQFWYTIDSAFAWDDGTGNVYFNYLYFDYEAGWDFADEISDYLAGEGLGEDEPLSEEQLAAIQELYAEFLDTADVTGESFGGIDLTYDGETWSVDEDAFEEELEQIFDVF